MKVGEAKRLTDPKHYPKGPQYLEDESYIIEGSRLLIYNYLKQNGKKSSRQIKNKLNLNQYQMKFALPTLIRLGFIRKVNYLLNMNKIDYEACI